MIPRQDSLLAHYQHFKENLLTTVRSAAFVEALRASSRGWSLSELADAGHPYSRLRPNRLFDPTIINEQKGDFKANWGKLPVLLGAQESRTGIFNDDEKSDWLINGTDVMVPRRIDLRVTRQTEAALREVEKRSLRRMDALWKARKSL